MNSKFYYQRRLSLTIIYIVAGILFLSFPIIGLFEPSSKNDLVFFSGEPQKISIEYEKKSKDEYIKLLRIEINDQTLKMAIGNREYQLLFKSLGNIEFVKKGEGIALYTPVDKIKLKNSYLKETDLKGVKLEGYLAKDIIKELMINKVEIVTFKQTSKIPYFILVLLGVLWIIWQIKILFHLINHKPDDLYR